MLRRARNRWLYRVIFYALVMAAVAPIIFVIVGPVILGYWIVLGDSSPTQLMVATWIQKFRVIPPWSKFFEMFNFQGMTFAQGLESAQKSLPGISNSVVSIFSNSANVFAVLIVIGILVIAYLVVTKQFLYVTKSVFDGLIDMVANPQKLIALVGIITIIVIPVLAYSWGSTRFFAAILDLLPTVAIFGITGAALWLFLRKSSATYWVFGVIIVLLLLAVVPSFLSGQAMITEATTISIPTNKLSGFFAGIGNDLTTDAKTLAVDLIVLGLAIAGRVWFGGRIHNNQEYEGE